MSDTYSDHDGRELPLPAINADLVAYLDTMFDIRCFKGAETAEQLHNLKGQFFVIDHLKALHAQQNEPQGE